MKKHLDEGLIPNGIYCDDCPYWHSLNTNMQSCWHDRELCQFKDTCPDDCENCDEEITYCEFLDYTEYGPFPLSDGCKACGIKEDFDLEE